MSGVGPHLSDDVLVIQPGTTQTRSLKATRHPRNSFVRLPNCRIITRLTGNDSPDWRLFTDRGFKRQVDGSGLAGWRIAAVSPDDFV